MTMKNVLKLKLTNRHFKKQVYINFYPEANYMFKQAIL